MAKNKKSTNTNPKPHNKPVIDGQMNRHYPEDHGFKEYNGRGLEFSPDHIVDGGNFEDRDSPVANENSPVLKSNL